MSHPKRLTAYEETNLRKLFNIHRENVRRARYLIDRGPPRLLIPQVMRQQRLMEYLPDYKKLKAANERIFITIAAISQCNGNLNPFREHDSNLMRKTYLQHVCSNMRKYEAENVLMGRRVMKAAPQLITLPPHSNASRLRIRRRIEQQLRPLPNVMAKYRTLDFLPQDAAIFKKFMRPIIWFDVNVPSVRPLGRIYMRLYTEACPTLVLELLKVCKRGDSSCLRFRRLFSDLWLDCDVKMDKSLVYQRKIEFDARVLDQSKHSALLSFPRCYMRDSLEGPINLFNFAISFRPLPAAAKYRIAFGRMLRAKRIIYLLESLGSKTGRIIHKIEISGCGLVE